MILVHAVSKPELPPFTMPDRFLTDVAYFMTPGGVEDAPKLGSKEYWIELSNAQRWLEEFVVEVISPLDASTKAEFELTDDQESWLQWLVDHEVSHVRLESK